MSTCQDCEGEGRIAVLNFEAGMNVEARRAGEVAYVEDCVRCSGTGEEPCVDNCRLGDDFALYDGSQGGECPCEDWELG